ncbi:hypothetical protein F030043B2_34250 [Bacteroides fragilis]|uniref:hypothetical protein n=1 Tax=Bacteroides fragilis TaxID=817 RepID=UPI00081899A5|nr:hypothetical protein [Bacteroides fragilis]OCR34459.1 hypothetical protein AC141_33450 [Bacteroides fragilis]USA58894.1 hypothetical protein NC657_06250 [Bacteroides fragilis]
MVVTIYWENKSTLVIRKRIRDRFGIPHYMSVNGETQAEIREEDMPDLMELVKRGFISLRNK